MTDFSALQEEIENLPTLFTVDLVDNILIEYLAITDFVAGSPREVLKKAFQTEMITGDVWMQMLEIRNRLTHDYDGEIVKTYCRTIVDVYIEKLKEFQLWVEGIGEESI